MNILAISDLHASIEGEKILRGVSLEIRPGEIHVLMGPNGSGKSTLAAALMGKPDVTVTGGSASINGIDLLKLPVTERAKQGLFLGFQYPMEISGVTISHFLRLAKNSVRSAQNPDTKPISVAEFKKELTAAAQTVGISDDVLKRELNVGFSGGEKKRLEMLQMLVLEPQYAILDETDSGLDIDALKLISKTIQKAAKEHNVGVLLITHYTRILKELTPDAVHVFIDGKIIKSGSKELAEEVEKTGYEQYTNAPTSSRVEPRDLAATV